MAVPLALRTLPSLRRAGSCSPVPRVFLPVHSVVAVPSGLGRVVLIVTVLTPAPAPVAVTLTAMSKATGSPCVITAADSPVAAMVRVVVVGMARTVRRALAGGPKAATAGSVKTPVTVSLPTGAAAEVHESAPSQDQLRSDVELNPVNGRGRVVKADLVGNHGPGGHRRRVDADEDDWPLGVCG